MKSLIVVIIVSVIATSLQAQTNTSPVVRFKKATLEQTEKSLVFALESKSPGMNASAAQTVRDLKALMSNESFSSLVIPLMRIVNDEQAAEYSRVLAALALHDLHSATGDYAIAGVAKFTDSPRLKRLCSWLTYYRLLEDHPDLATVQVAKLSQ